MLAALALASRKSAPAFSKHDVTSQQRAPAGLDSFGSVRCPGAVVAVIYPNICSMVSFRHAYRYPAPWMLGE